MKNVAVVSGTRADYGLLTPVMRGIQESPTLALQLLVTGSHWLPEFGSTSEAIERDGFAISSKIMEISSASTCGDVAQQVGYGLVAFARAFEKLQPDVVLVLGDRYEIFAAASAAFFMNIPILHVHGGEVTSGAFDDAIRHAVSQLSRIHAVAAPEYRDRLIRAGAHPDTVQVVGGLGVDVLNRASLVPRSTLERELGLDFGHPLFLVTYHPVTAAHHDTLDEVGALFAALDSFPDATVVFTLPNADPEHREIIQSLEEAVLARQGWHLFSSLGSTNYLSLMALASVVVGNSSSGLTEAPSLGTPTVNIGPRQDGRLIAESVLSCSPKVAEIVDAIRLATTAEFIASFEGSVSPYGQPGAAQRVVEILEGTAFDNLREKKYYDTPARG